MPPLHITRLLQVCFVLELIEVVTWRRSFIAAVFIHLDFRTLSLLHL